MTTHPSQPGEQQNGAATIAAYDKQFSSGRGSGLPMFVLGFNASHAQSQARIASLEGALEELVESARRYRLMVKELNGPDKDIVRFSLAINRALAALNNPPQ
jgi:hypothetical protein